MPLATILREWGRIGCIGFGGPPTHIALLRDSGASTRRQWLTRGEEFEDAIAVCNLLPGPASTQLAIFCAWRLRRRRGALVGGTAFIVPGLVLLTRPWPCTSCVPRGALSYRPRSGQGWRRLSLGLMAYS